MSSDGELTTDPLSSDDIITAIFPDNRLDRCSRLFHTGFVRWDGSSQPLQDESLKSLQRQINKDVTLLCKHEQKQVDIEVSDVLMTELQSYETLETHPWKMLKFIEMMETLKSFKLLKKVQSFLTKLLWIYIVFNRSAESDQTIRGVANRISWTHAD